MKNLISIIAMVLMFAVAQSQPFNFEQGQSTQGNRGVDTLVRYIMTNNGAGSAGFKGATPTDTFYLYTDGDTTYWTSDKDLVLKPRGGVNGIVDVVGQIKIQGGDPDSMDLLVSIDETGLARWESLAAVFDSANGVIVCNPTSSPTIGDVLTSSESNSNCIQFTPPNTLCNSCDSINGIAITDLGGNILWDSVGGMLNNTIITLPINYIHYWTDGTDTAYHLIKSDEAVLIIENDFRTIPAKGKIEFDGSVEISAEDTVTGDQSNINVSLTDITLNAQENINMAGVIVIIQESSGNVGIGTATPASKLTVTGGDVYITDAASGTIYTADDGGCWRVNVNNDGTRRSTSITCP